MKLKIGGAKKDGYTTIDIDPATDPDVVMDATKIEYQENSIDEIYSCHFIEHISRNEGREFINNAYKILKPGGIIVTEFPDFKELCSRYANGEYQLEWPMFGSQVNPYQFHKYMYCADTFKALLEKNNFKIIEISPGKTGHSSSICITAQK